MGEIKPTPKTLTVTYNGSENTITMYYGLLNDLLEKVRDLGNVSNMFTDPDVRNACISALLSERDEMGNIKVLKTPFNVDIDYLEVEKILSWAASHVTGFFVRSLKQLTERLQESYPRGSDGRGRDSLDVTPDWFKGLSFDEAVLWAFEIFPAELSKIYWSHTLSEIRLMVRMRLSWCQAQSLQQYQIMAILLKQAFGGEDSKSSPDPAPPSSMDQAQAQLKAFFNPR